MTLREVLLSRICHGGNLDKAVDTRRKRGCQLLPATVVPIALFSIMQGRKVPSVSDGRDHLAPGHHFDK